VPFAAATSRLGHDEPGFCWDNELPVHAVQTGDFALGDRLITGLYDLLEGLVAARYATAKLERLETLNARLDLLRLQIRLLHSFQLIDTRRYEHVALLVEDVGRQLGGWISQQRRLSQPVANA
jgi:hypothetical protein